jgi:hypothetical protein
MQNLVPSGVSASQRGQRIDRPSRMAVRVAAGRLRRSSGAFPDRRVTNDVSVLRSWPSVKRKAPGDPGAAVEGQGGPPSTVGISTMVMGGYDPRPERLAVSSRFAKLRKSLRFKTLWRLYVDESLLEGLAQHLQDVAAELRQFIQEEDAVVCQRPLARHRDLASPDQPHIGDGVMGGTKWARGDECGAGAGAAGNTVVMRAGPA